MAYGIKELCDFEGFDDPMDMLEEYIGDSGCPGICTKCGETHWVEHDCRSGHCSCGSDSIKSCFDLMGII